MRVFPMITALLVCVVLYGVVMQRDRLVSFAQSFRGETPAPEAAAMPEADTAPEAEAPAGLRPGTVSVVTRHSVAQEVDTAVVLRGRTEAARQVVVRAETSGRIVSDPIRAGAFVEEGQLLCEIAPGTREAALAEAVAGLATARSRLPEAEARVDEAEARLQEAQINNTAASRLSESGFGSETRAVSTAAAVSSAEAAIRSAQAGVESARSGIQSAEAAVTRAEQEIERLRITAPFAGLLEGDTAELGALMQPGTDCATVIQLDPIKLVGYVPEADVARIENGTTAGAQLATGQRVQGTVTFLSRSADPQTRTFRVEITVPNADLEIRDGQTADILIAAPGQMAHLVPSSALTLNDEGILGVRIVDDTDTARFAPVSFLRDTVDGVLVADLPETVDVIVVGQEFVTDGVPVDPHEQEPTQ
ncbi:efflux RND transporter periplasmic adaptor subunit [Nioella nitratireducens]|uniref:efflux RND transporter periplasmic adaptor subunit n=1 Tax=Nioella nitratireducens TaxID=1287720 RepID=UPI0008FD464C|nr:efflux RND transporter periplasmic adaptor subunit [Nioella nitratireducens]